MFPRFPAAPLLALALTGSLLAGCIIVPIPVPRASSSDSPGLAALPLPRLPARAAAAAEPDPGPAPASARCPRPDAADAATAEILARTNSLRKDRGLPAVRLSPRLQAVAQGHACDNAARASFAHTGSDGSDLTARLRRGDYRYATAIENTGLGFVDAPGRMAGFWEGSAGHRANLLHPRVTEAGLGLAEGKGGPAWVLVMARPR